ncbi:SPOR domain-containing protein [Ruegeria arenilitoris]|uniref:SPOR domain-containing protein n=1 Tax=Ruegeria arenilitoris TaxID=1173585 RepID=UPI00147F0E19
MKRAKGTRFGPQRLAVLTAVLLALSGCEEGFDLQGAAASGDETDAAENDQTVELFPQPASGSQRDVEAPDVFQVTESGLWDGRPSLGGIWVAHPDVDQPERVVIKNTTNNKTVTGALFRRERNLPGPALQVSSSAANELGMLAGSPSNLKVVALRREQKEVAPAEEKPKVDGSAETEVAENDSATSEDTEATTSKRKWWQKKPTDQAGATAVAAGAAAGAVVSGSDGAETDTETAPKQTAAAAEPDAETLTETAEKRKWWQKKPVEETDVASGSATASGDAVDRPTESANQTAALADPEVKPPAENPNQRKWWQKQDPNEITETPLDPIAGAAAAIEASEPTVAETTATAAETTATSNSLSKPFVQVGTFGVEANAKSAAEKIRRNGMDAQVRELKTDDDTVWRVVVGPADSKAQRKAILSDVKDLGFTDAFTASN